MPNKKKKGFRRRSTGRVVKPVISGNRGAKRKMWTEEQMLAAMESARSGELSVNRSAVFHGVPRVTLQDQMNGRVQHGRKPGPSPYLTQGEEGELCSYLLSTAEVGYGKTRREVRKRKSQLLVVEMLLDRLFLLS